MDDSGGAKIYQRVDSLTWTKEEEQQCRKARIARNHIGCAILVWIHLKQVAVETQRTIYRVKHDLLDAYLCQQLNPQNIWNRSVFPYAIPLGFFLLWLSIRKRNPYFALASAPFFALYHSFYTYIVVQIGLMHPDVEKYIRRDVLQIILSVFFWVIMLYFRL